MDVKVLSFAESEKYTLRNSSDIQAICEVVELNIANDASLIRLTRLGSKILNTSFCGISIVDEHFHRFKLFNNLPDTSLGLPRTLPIADSLCQYTLNGDFVKIDDIRSFDSPVSLSVINKRGFHSYLGASIRLEEDGPVIGAVYVLDYEVRKWTLLDIEHLQDVAKCVQTEIQYQLRQARGAREGETRDRVLSMLAHDLRTPLNIIQNNAELVMLEECDISMKVDCAASILRCSEHAVHLIEDFLDWKLSNLGLSDCIGKDAFDIVPLAQTCLYDLTRVHGDLFKIEFNQKPIVGEFNQVAIRRVLENLLNNAVKYGDTSRAITLTLNSVADDTVEIIVHNYGNPLSPKDLKKIFDPYYRSNNAKNSESKGWGIGLALVQSVAYAHGGTVEAESDEEAGTYFKLVLPMSVGQKI